MLKLLVILFVIKHCELLRLNFKHKNDIKRKRIRAWQILMDRYSKGEFHVFIKELKLFDHEFFFFTLLLDILIFQSDVLQSLFF